MLKSNAQHGLQDPQNQNARSSWEPSSDSNSYGEFCDSTVDHRIAGVPLSEPNKVKRLIKQFDSLSQDLKQTQKINKFSKESQDLIADMNNTEIFELCENSSKQQCLDCNAYWEMGIIYWSCGRKTQSTQSPTEFDQNNRDVTSIPPWMRDQEKQQPSTELMKDKRCTTRRNRCLRKQDKKSTGAIPQVFDDGTPMQTTGSRFFDVGWREFHIILYDRISLEKHIYKATRAERIQIANNWILTANSEGGPQPPLNQRPDFAQAKRECRRLHDEHLTRTQQKYRDIPRSQQIRQRKRATISRPRRPWLRRWPEHRLEVLQTVAEKPADICVKLAGQPASSFVIVVNLGPNPVEDEQLRFSAFFKSWQLVKVFS